MAAAGLGYALFNPYPLALNTASPSFVVDETIFYASRNLSQPQLFFGEIIPTLLLKTLNNNFTLADALFPPLTFLALGWLFFTLTKNHYWSIFGSILTIGFFHYLNYFPYLPSVIAKIFASLSAGTYSLLIRTPHPQLTLVFFSVFACLIWLRLSRRLPDWPVSLGLAILTYSHFFYWTFGLVWLLTLRLFRALPLWLVLAFPYFINQWQLTQLSVWPEFLAESYYAPPPNFNQISLLVFCLILIQLIKARKLKQFWQSFYLSATVIIAASALLHFGADDPIGHWFTRVIEPLTIVMFITLINQKVRFIRPVWLAMLSLLLLIYLWQTQRIYFNKNRAGFVIEPEKIELFKWLNQNTPDNSIVVTASLVDNLYLPAHTNNQVFIPRSQVSLVPSAEQLDRFLIAQKLAGKSEAGIRLMFSKNEGLKTRKRFEFDNCAGIYLFFRLYAGRDYYDCRVPEPVLEQILEQYRQTRPDLTKYRADYWLGTEPVEFGRLLWENQTYKIYALR